MATCNIRFAMPASRLPYALAFAALLLASPALAADPIAFGGFNWTVRSDTGTPGPNTFDPANVSVDKDGLHLKISQTDGRWTSAELVTTAPLGFGTYQFEISGRPDQL